MTLDADVVVMDLRMRNLDGIEATRRLRSHPDTPPVLVLTTFDDDESLSGAIRAGASGFILKDAAGEEIQQAVRALAAGGCWLDPGITGRVLDRYREDANTAVATIDELTTREVDVLRLIGRGATNGEIASGLLIGEGTVKTHISHIFVKLGLRDRAAAIVFAFDNGLVRPRS